MAVVVDFLIEELPDGKGITFTNMTDEDGTTPVSYQLTLTGDIIDITGWVMNEPLEISADAFPGQYVDGGILKDGAYEFKLTYTHSTGSE